MLVRVSHGCVGFSWLRLVSQGLKVAGSLRSDFGGNDKSRLLRPHCVPASETGTTYTTDPPKPLECGWHPHPALEAPGARRAWELMASRWWGRAGTGVQDCLLPKPVFSPLSLLTQGSKSDVLISQGVEAPAPPTPVGPSGEHLLPCTEWVLALVS